MHKIILAALILSAALCLLPILAMAQEAGFMANLSVACGRSEPIVKVLFEKYGERPVNQGITKRGELVQIWASAKGTFTVLKISPSGVACMLDSGDDWSIEVTDPLKKLPTH